MHADPAKAIIGALIIRIGFGGILYCNYNKEPPKTLFLLRPLQSSLGTSGSKGWPSPGCLQQEGWLT